MAESLDGHMHLLLLMAASVFDLYLRYKIWCDTQLSTNNINIKRVHSSKSFFESSKVIEICRDFGVSVVCSAFILHGQRSN